MRYLSIAFLAMLLVGCSEMSTKQVVDKVEPGTVLIADELDNGQGGIGTGFIVKENTIVTNHHVISEPGKLFVFSPTSKKKYEAEVVFKDSLADLAVLKLKNWEAFMKETSPVVVRLGDSEKTEKGDKIIVIGHPWGLTWSVSEGIVSSKNRRIDPTPKFLDQVDAHLFQGNSGGPVFNENGEVVCVSNMMMSKEGGSYGFCIPSNLVKKVLYDFETFGNIRWRAMNVSVGLTEDGSSVIFKDVEPDGAAGKAGLKINDKVLEIYTPKNHPNGIKVTSPDDLITELAQLNGDEENIKLLIERNGEKIMVDVKTNFRLTSDYPSN